MIGTGLPPLVWRRPRGRCTRRRWGSRMALASWHFWCVAASEPDGGLAGEPDSLGESPTMLAAAKGRQIRPHAPSPPDRVWAGSRGNARCASGAADLRENAGARGRDSAFHGFDDPLAWRGRTQMKRKR